MSAPDLRSDETKYFDAEIERAVLRERERCAQLAERFADKLMREATKHHDAEEPDYDRYEELECMATVLSIAATKIRNRARRR